MLRGSADGAVELTLFSLWISKVVSGLERLAPALGR
jgi:hypothetical protein